MTLFLLVSLNATAQSRMDRDGVTLYWGFVPLYGLVLTVVNVAMLVVVLWVMDRGNTLAGSGSREEKRAAARERIRQLKAQDADSDVIVAANRDELLARPALAVGSWLLTPAIVLWVLTTLWYLTRGNLMLGLAVSVVAC